MLLRTLMHFVQATLTPFAFAFVSVLFWTSGVFASPSVAMAPPNAAVSQSDAAARVPFVYDPLIERDIVVQVRIGKHKPLPFFVDTGFDAPIIVNRWAAKELNLPTGGMPITLNPGNNTGYTVPPQDVALVGGGSGGDYIARPATMYVADVTSTTTFLGRKAGVIGLPFLKAANLQIDFPRRQLLFLPLANMPAMPPGSLELALRPDANPALYDAILPAIPSSSVPSRALPLLLDTGSDACLLPPYLIPDLRPAVATLGGQTTLAGSGTVANWFVPSLKLGPIAAENVLVSEASSTVGLLGLDVLSRFVVTLDWAGQRMWLTPTAVPALAVPGATDVQLTEVKGYILVDQVAPGSPAAQAGLCSEQKVLRVDGHDTDGVHGAEVELALAGYAGTTARVTVEDNAGQHDVVFLRRSLVDPASYDGIGLRLVHPERAHTGWYVQTLLCASRAFQHGIRPDDFISAVGKTGIGSLPLLMAEQLLREATVGTKVTVQRPIALPLPIGTSAASPLPDLSQLSPNVRGVIETLLKEGWSTTKLPDGTFSMTPPLKGGKSAFSADGKKESVADTGKVRCSPEPYGTARGSGP